MRLLVVDDSPLDRSIVAEVGGLLGIAVSEAEGGADANAAGFDVVLLDGHIPGEDIGDVACKLRRSNPEARIILWSGAPDAVAPTLPEGCVDDVWQKPLDLGGIEETLRQLVVVA